MLVDIKNIAQDEGVDLKPETRRRRKSLIVPILILLILLLALFLAAFLVNTRTSFFGRARSISQPSRGTIDIKNSYMFISPLSAAANGEEKIRLTVFVLNDQGLGIGGKQVVLGEDERLTIDQIQPMTDEYGRAIFDISCGNTGDYYIEASVDKKILPQRLKLMFR